MEGGVRGGALSFRRTSRGGLRSQGCHEDGNEREERRRVKSQGERKGGRKEGDRDGEKAREGRDKLSSKEKLP